MKKKFPSLTLLISVCVLSISPLFAIEIHSIKGDWPERQIEKDLSFLSHEQITSEAIEHYNHDKLYCYKIQDGEFSVVNVPIYHRCEERHQVMSEMIKRILEVTDLPDMTFLVAMGDAFDGGDKSDMMPIFVFSKKQDLHAQILLPAWEICRDLHPGGRLQQSRVASKRYPWHLKRSQAFWRGSPTGFYVFNTGEKLEKGCHSDSWRELPRAQLTLIAKSAPKVINACFTTHFDERGVHPEIPQELGPPALYCPIVQHIPFKYLIDIDGNSYGTRLEWAMVSNCMPIRVEGLWALWYYNGLEPYKHYLPVKGDCSDLIDQVRWAQAHDDKAYQIALESRDFANRYFTENAIASYIYHLLYRYSELIN